MLDLQLLRRGRGNASLFASLEATGAVPGAPGSDVRDPGASPPELLPARLDAGCAARAGEARGEARGGALCPGPPARQSATAPPLLPHHPAGATTAGAAAAGAGTAAPTPRWASSIDPFAALTQNAAAAAAPTKARVAHGGWGVALTSPRAKRIGGVVGASAMHVRRLAVCSKCLYV